MGLEQITGRAPELTEFLANQGITPIVPMGSVQKPAGVVYNQAIKNISQSPATNALHHSIILGGEGDKGLVHNILERFGIDGSVPEGSRSKTPDQYLMASRETTDGPSGDQIPKRIVACLDGPTFAREFLSSSKGGIFKKKHLQQNIARKAYEELFVSKKADFHHESLSDFLKACENDHYRALVAYEYCPKTKDYTPRSAVINDSAENAVERASEEHPEIPKDNLKKAYEKSFLAQKIIPFKEFTNEKVFMADSWDAIRAGFDAGIYGTCFIHFSLVPEDIERDFNITVLADNWRIPGINSKTGQLGAISMTNEQGELLPVETTLYAITPKGTQFTPPAKLARIVTDMDAEDETGALLGDPSSAESLQEIKEHNKAAIADYKSNYHKQDKPNSTTE